MFAIRRWDPFSELSSLRREMDDFFKRTLGITQEFIGGEKAGWYPRVDSFLNKGNVVVRMELPGVDAKDVDISVRGNQMIIKGEKKAEKDVKGEDYVLCEACYGSFERAILLPEGVEADKIHASYKNGILEVTMPAAKAALPKKVNIEIEGPPVTLKKVA